MGHVRPALFYPEPPRLPTLNEISPYHGRCNPVAVRHSLSL